MFRNILVAVDGSPASVKAVEWALRAHMEDPKLNITFMYVHMPYTNVQMPGYGVVDMDTREFLQDMPNPTPAEEALNLFEDPSNIKQKSLFGNPASALLHEAQHGGYDCIVLGSKGHGAIASVLIGSVSARILHHAPCSVLIIR